MVSIAITDDKFPALCSAILDAQLREVIILLSDGPLDIEKTAEVLGIGLNDSEARLERLTSAGLLRKTIESAGAKIFSLDFSMERLGSPFDSKIAAQLAKSLSEVLYAFLESHAKELSVFCENTCLSPARAIEQLFLASFSSIANDLKSEVADEDKEISRALGKSLPKKRT